MIYENCEFNLRLRAGRRGSEGPKRCRPEPIPTCRPSPSSRYSKQNARRQQRAGIWARRSVFVRQILDALNRRRLGCGMSRPGSVTKIFKTLVVFVPGKPGAGSIRWVSHTVSVTKEKDRHHPRHRRTGWRTENGAMPWARRSLAPVVDI